MNDNPLSNILFSMEGCVIDHISHSSISSSHNSLPFLFNLQMSGCNINGPSCGEVPSHDTYLLGSNIDVTKTFHRVRPPSSMSDGGFFEPEIIKNCIEVASSKLTAKLHESFRATPMKLFHSYSFNLCQSYTSSPQTMKTLDTSQIYDNQLADFVMSPVTASQSFQVRQHVAIEEDGTADVIFSHLHYSPNISRTTPQNCQPPPTPTFNDIVGECLSSFNYPQSTNQVNSEYLQPVTTGKQNGGNCLDRILSKVPVQSGELEVQVRTSLEANASTVEDFSLGRGDELLVEGVEQFMLEITKKNIGNKIYFADQIENGTMLPPSELLPFNLLYIHSGKTFPINKICLGSDKGFFCNQIENSLPVIKFQLSQDRVMAHILINDTTMKEIEKRDFWPSLFGNDNTSIIVEIADKTQDFILLMVKFCEKLLRGLGKFNFFFRNVPIQEREQLFGHFYPIGETTTQLCIGNGSDPIDSPQPSTSYQPPKISNQRDKPSVQIDQPSNNNNTYHISYGVHIPVVNQDPKEKLMQCFNDKFGESSPIKIINRKDLNMISKIFPDIYGKITELCKPFKKGQGGDVVEIIQTMDKVITDLTFLKANVIHRSGAYGPSRNVIIKISIQERDVTFHNSVGEQCSFTVKDNGAIKFLISCYLRHYLLKKRKKVMQEVVFEIENFPNPIRDLKRGENLNIFGIIFLNIFRDLLCYKVVKTGKSSLVIEF